MTPEEKEAIDKIAGILDSVIANFDQHLKDDHKMENHGYVGKGKDATLRFYLENCHGQLIDARKELEEL